MSIDFHVKYRPSDFDLMVGQEHVITALKAFEQANKWPHAYLFTGGSGCGKTTLARIVANKLGCAPSNFTEVDAASNSGIDNIRTLTASLMYKGFDKNYVKVYLIDECHSLSKAAWQALLKPIEEPPEHVYFMFCTTEQEKVPDTIKTRCQQFNLKSVSIDDILALIEFVAHEEGIKLEEKSLSLIAQEALGSPRRALTFLSKSAGCSSFQEVLRVLESPDEDKEVIDLCRLLCKKDSISWNKVLLLIKKMESISPESVRILVTNYISKVLLNTTKQDEVLHLLNVLDAFSKPFNQNDKLAPLFLAVGKIVFDIQE